MASGPMPSRGRWAETGDMTKTDEATLQPPASPAASSSLIGVALFMAGMFVWTLGQLVGDTTRAGSWALYLIGGAVAVNGFVWMCRLWFSDRLAWLFAIPFVAELYVIGQDPTSDLSYALMVHMALVVLAVVLTVSGLLRSLRVAG